MMTRNFSLKTFFRNASPDLLRQYFEQKTLLADFDWSQENEALAEALHQRIEAMPDSYAEVINQDFATISEFADEEGVLGLIDVIRTVCIDAEPVIDAMMAYPSFTDRILWASINHPDTFDWAIRIERVEKMTFKEDLLAGRNLHCSTDEDAIDKLKDYIQKFYKRQRRGRYCHIDTYTRQNPTRYCFFAYPEDYPRRDLTYKSSQLVPQIRRPVLEIVFIYEPGTGNLKIHASKMRKIEVMQEAFCKAILGLSGIPDGSTRVYELSRLLDPAFRFVTEPQDQVESVTLRMLKTKIDRTTNGKITCEGDSQDGGTELVRTMMTRAIAACDEGLIRSVEVLSAKITMKFAANNGGSAKKLTFILTDPSGSTLEDKPHDHIARKYLEKWGLVRMLMAENEDAA